MSERSIPPSCPSCSKRLVVVRLECPACGSEVTGEFDPCPVCRLPEDSRRLFETFLKARGNLRRVQRELGVSYPTTRQRIEELFQQLGYGSQPADPRAVLARLRSGEITVDEAERRLRGNS